MNPKHPTSPPYRSSLVVSRSKETEKHMTTIPKPIVYSKWKSWNMDLLDKNGLRWFPSGYENIQEHIFSQWKEILVTTLKNMGQTDRLLVYIHYNPKMSISDVKAWNLQVEYTTEKILQSNWSWRYDPPESRYLLYLIRKDLHEQITSPEGLQTVKQLTKRAIGIILANSDKF